MARQVGTNIFPGSLEVLAGAPLDARSVVDSVDDLIIQSNFPYPYIGMNVTVKNTGDIYTLMNMDVTNINNWKKQAGGGGGSSEWVDVPFTLNTEIFKDNSYIVFKKFQGFYFLSLTSIALKDSSYVAPANTKVPIIYIPNNEDFPGTKSYPYEQRYLQQDPLNSRLIAIDRSNNSIYAQYTKDYSRMTVGVDGISHLTFCWFKTD